MNAKAKKLTKLDTRGVAVVTSGANNKRFAFAKGADGSATIEDLFLEVIAKGEMPMDDKSIEAMCAKAGCDAQMTETVKAIAKLRHVYRDNAAFLGVVKQLVSGGGEGGAGESAQQPGGDDAAGESKQPTDPSKETNDQAGAEASVEEAAEDAADEQQDQAPEEGEKEEPPMPDKTEETKKTAELIAKAADAEKKAADAEKRVAELEAVAKSQEAVLKANTEAVKKMQDEMKLQGWVAKAKDELSFIPGKTAAELGKMLFDIDALNPAMATAQFDLLKSQAEVIQKSNLFRPAGVSGAAPVGGDIMAEVEKQASEMVSKSDRVEPREVALARARAQIFKNDPALYARYSKEQERAQRAGN